MKEVGPGEQEGEREGLVGLGICLDGLNRLGMLYFFFLRFSLDSRIHLF
jgi:hypothetical protein